MKKVIHSWLRVPLAIGKVTFLEIIRDKVLYNILLITVGLIFVGILASYMAYVRPIRILKDFGLATVNISCIAVGILIGAGLLKKEIERRTIFVALSKPISQSQFILGKYFGISLVLILNWVLLSGSVFFVTLLFTRGFGDFSYSVFWIGLFFVLLQSLLLTALSVLFSTFTTASLSVVFTFGLLVVGNNVSEIKALIGKMDPSLLQDILRYIVLALPNLENFNLGLQFTYDLPVTLAQFSLTVLYWFVSTLTALGVSGFLIQTREV